MIWALVGALILWVVAGFWWGWKCAFTDPWYRSSASEIVLCYPAALICFCIFWVCVRLGLAIDE